MKCWIASFPRSGNTYFRNILYYVYGIESSTWHKESTYPIDADYDKFDFVKTHLLPSDLKPTDGKIPAIYLVRDGRDAMVSIAHHRSDIVQPGSDFAENLKDAIIAAEGSFFGGWSRNVNEWIERADIIIKYEDLIKDPQAVLARVEQVVDMPPANWVNLPDFKSMKFGKPKYGGQTTSKTIQISSEDFSKKFFRKGKAGSWKEEFTPELLELFSQRHGAVMDRLGYEGEFSPIKQNVLLDFKAIQKLGLNINLPSVSKSRISILIEGNKLQVSKNDGIKRYLIQLLKGFDEIERLGSPEFKFDLLINNRILSVREFLDHIKSEVTDLKAYEKVLLGFKSLVKSTLPTSIYNPIAGFYRNSDIRFHLRKLRAQVYQKEENKLVNKYESTPGGYDLIHLPLPQNYEAIRKLKGKLLVTIHDITHRIFPEFHTKENIALTEEGLKFCFENANHYIAISSNTRVDLIKQYDVQQNSISTILEAADVDLFYQNFNPSLAKLVRNKYKIGKEPYFLCLSTLEPRKNLLNTVKSFNFFKVKHPDSPMKLVIAGEKGWKYEEILSSVPHSKSDVIFTGFIEDRDLHVLYSEALAFFYLSYYEGFGLPPLEAACCKTAVVHSGKSSLTEVIGNHGIVVEPDNIEAIAEAMHKLSQNEAYRNKIAQACFDHAMTFSWRKTIFETLSLYLKISK